MPGTRQTDDNDEAKRELLATLSAARELDPLMDDALADRYLEKVRAARPNTPFDSATARAQLLTTLKSARGSDPAGDDALASDYLARLRSPAPANAFDPYLGQPYYGQPPMAPAPYGAPMPPSAPVNPAFMYLPMIAITIGFVISLIVTRGETWWLFWLIPASMGWSRRGRYYRMQRRALPPNGDPRMLPPQQRPPEFL